MNRPIVYVGDVHGIWVPIVSIARKAQGSIQFSPLDIDEAWEVPRTLR